MRFKFHNLSSLFKFHCNNKYNSYYQRKPPSLFLLHQPLNPHLQNPYFFKIPRRWHLAHSHDHHRQHRHEEGENIFRLGLSADIGLATGKALTGYLSGSTAIIADAAHSISDVVLSGVALLSFKAGKAPKDKEHPYGHGKFESLGALGISCMLLGTAGGIAWHALDLLIGLLSMAPEVVNHSLTHDHGHSHVGVGHQHGIDMDHPVLALSMTIISISVKEGLYRITKRAGEKQGSGLMKANAWHHRADAISSVVALVGVGGSILGIKFLDPLAGLVVSGMILKAGLQTGYQSVLELVDAAISTDDLGPIKETILQVEGVKGCHRLRGRRAGSSLYLDVHIEVDPFLSVSAAHGIGENVRQEIHKSFPEIFEAFIHIDPAFLHSPSNQVEQQDHIGGVTSWNSISFLDNKDIEAILSRAMSKFPEEMEVQHITRHVLQGKIWLQIEVSMPPHLLISEAKEVAKAAEKEILSAAPNITQACFLLRLGHSLPESGIDCQGQDKAARRMTLQQ